MTTTKQPLFLRVLKNGKLLDVKQFTGSQVVIGREGKVDALVNDASVSPIHAMIEEREDGKYYLSDLGSASGTLIDGEKVVDAQLESGSEFQIGDLTIEFHIGVPKPKKAGGAATASVAEPKKKEKEVTATSIPKEVPKRAPTTTPLTSAPLNTTVTMAGMASTSGGGTVTGSHKRTGPAQGTFAPPSSAKIAEATKPGTGNVVEVVMVWHDRILNTYHFDKAGVINIGSHPQNQIILPNFGSVRVAHPLIKIEGGSTNVYLTQDMTGELIRDNQTTSIDEMRKKGTLMPSGAGYMYGLQQNEALKINFGEGVYLVIRYVGSAPESRLIPLVDLSVNQLTAIVVGLMATALFLFYAYLYAPTLPEQNPEEQEPPRKAVMYYKKMPKEKEVADLSQQEAPKNANQDLKTKEPPAPSQGVEGASQEPKHTPNTTNKIAKAKGKSKTAAAPAAPPKAPPAKDVSKMGLMGAFAKGGAQNELNKAFSGAGNVQGLSNAATGRAGGTGTEDGGQGLRDVGANGNGTATVGIAGVKTKGRGGGLSGYGLGGLGAKKNASLIAGDDQATFTGSIDKEAIRRVVQANLRQIKSCYEKGLNREPGLYGKIVIQWTIGAGGRVLEAGIKNSTMNSSEVENCAVMHLRTWKFPEPPSGEVAVVSYPFVFQAQE